MLLQESVIDFNLTRKTEIQQAGARAAALQDSLSTSLTRCRKETDQSEECSEIHAGVKQMLQQYLELQLALNSVLDRHQYIHSAKLQNVLSAAQLKKMLRGNQELKELSFKLSSAAASVRTAVMKLNRAETLFQSAVTRRDSVNKQIRLQYSQLNYA